MWIPHPSSPCLLSLPGHSKVGIVCALRVWVVAAPSPSRRSLSPSSVHNENGSLRQERAGTASALLPHMGLLEVFTARDRLPRSACHHQTAPSRSPLANPFRADRYLQGTPKGAKRLRTSFDLQPSPLTHHASPPCSSVGYPGPNPWLAVTTHLCRVPPSSTLLRVPPCPSQNEWVATVQASRATAVARSLLAGHTDHSIRSRVCEFCDVILQGPDAIFNSIPHSVQRCKVVFEKKFTLVTLRAKAIYRPK
jgi:hypothetical protein